MFFLPIGRDIAIPGRHATRRHAYTERNRRATSPPWKEPHRLERIVWGDRNTRTKSTIRRPAARSGEGDYLFGIPFPNNTIPSGQLNAASQAFAAQFYPKPNLNVAEESYPAYFNGGTDHDQKAMCSPSVSISYLPLTTAACSRASTVPIKIRRPLNFNVSTEVIPVYARVAALGYTFVQSENHPELSLRIHLAKQLCQRWTIGSRLGDGHGAECANSRA